MIAEGESPEIGKAIELVESIKGEPPLMPRKAICEMCRLTSPAQADGPRAAGSVPAVSTKTGRRTNFLLT